MAIKYNDDWKKANATAIANVATSVASSTATDHMDLARAGTHIQNLIINVFHLEGRPEDVNERSLGDLEKEALEYEKQAQSAGLPNTYVFQLKQDLENCLRGADTIAEKASCWLHYIAGLGKVISDWLPG